MSLPRYKLIAAFVMLLLLLMASEGTAGLTHGRDSLRGLKGVSVVINSSKNVDDLGITQDMLQVAIEVALRKAGIRVYEIPSEYEEWHKEGGPTLSVDITRAKGGSNSAESISVVVVQDVQLPRNGSLVFAMTWSVDALILNYRGDTLRKEILDLVDFFINDYLAVNPKK